MDVFIHLTMWQDVFFMYYGCRLLSYCVALLATRWQVLSDKIEHLLPSRHERYPQSQWALAMMVHLNAHPVHGLSLFPLSDPPYCVSLKLYKVSVFQCM